jgi:predicted polyphosphate/ATP-dependent NAD kinase
MEIKFAEDLARKKGEIEKQSLESKKKLDEEQKKHQEDLYNAIGQGLGALSNLVGENSAQGKAIAIAQAIIDTYTGATKAFAQGGTFGYIGAAAVIASGLANVKKIASVKIPGAKNESTNTDMSAPSGPNVSIISGQMNSSAQLLGSLNNSLSTPPRAYVVGQDVNSQQSLDRHIRQNATL